MIYVAKILQNIHLSTLSLYLSYKWNSANLIKMSFDQFMNRQLHLLENVEINVFA